MSREFIIGAMNLTPYFVRRERETYIFRDVPAEILAALITYSRDSYTDSLIAIYINPKICFSTFLITNEPYPDGVLFRAHYRGDVHSFFVQLPKELRDAYWVGGI